jgi:hypothetical protein
MQQQSNSMVNQRMAFPIVDSQGNVNTKVWAVTLMIRLGLKDDLNKILIDPRTDTTVRLLIIDYLSQSKGAYMPQMSKYLCDIIVGESEQLT